MLSKYAKATVTPFSERYNFKKPGEKEEIKLKIAMDKINKEIVNKEIVATLSTVITYATALLAINTAGIEKSYITKRSKGEKRCDVKKNGK